MDLMWIVYWLNPSDGIEPLGLIAACPTREKAYEFLYKSESDGIAGSNHPLFSDDQRERIGVTSVPYRSSPYR